MNKQKILFIVNPKAGAKKHENMPDIIGQYLDKNTFQADFAFTKYAGNASEMAQKAVEEKYAVVVAVGGDGTVNEIAKVLKNTSTALGIIPRGSGNGLARDLGISMNPKKAIETLNNQSIIQMDTCLINETIPFFCTAGIGFDARCAEMFAGSEQRGLLNYVWVGWREYWKYQPLSCSFGGNKYQIFSLTFANAKQFGNNAIIAPNALINDGFIDCTILNPPPTSAAPQLIYQLFKGRLHESPYVELYRGTEFSLESEKNFQIHFDGEPMALQTNQLRVSIEEKKLKVLI